MNSTLAKVLRGSAVVLVLAAVFSILGIYSTNGDPFLRRYFMWLLTIGVGLVSAVFVAPWLFRRAPAAFWPAWVQVPIAAAIISVPVTVSLILMDASDGVAMRLSYWPMQFLYVYVVSLVLTFVAFLYVSREEARAAAERLNNEGAPAQPLGSGFLARLPARYRTATLYAVSSEDHYLRVHTDLGEELILMRLSDAVDLLSGLEGMQVHRSWWVARRGIADARRENDKAVLVLKSGTEAPVSRTYLKAVRDAGFLSAESLA